MFDFLKRRSPRDRLADRTMKAIRASGWEGPLTYDRETFRLDLGGDDALSLETLFRDADTLEKQDQAIAAAVADLFGELDVMDYVQVANKLLPLIRNRAQVTGWDQDQDDRQLSQPLAGPLTLLLTIELPNGIHIVSRNTAEDWGRTFEELLAVATENLRARDAAPFERAEGGFFIARFDSYYDTARLLLGDVLGALPLEGKPVAITVSRSILTVTGSEDILGLNAMAEFVDQAVRDDPRPIAFAPLVLEDGEWKPFMPKGYGLAAVRLLWVKQRLWDYSIQTDILQARQDGAAHDVFVAPLEAIPEDEAHIHTWTSWHQGGLAWLPRADAVGLTRKDGQRIMRAWEDIEAVCGAFPVVPDTWPERYVGDLWPTDAQWAELSARPAPPWFPL